jgi:serine/threonine protein kinase
MLAKVGYREFAVKVVSRHGAKYAISEITALQKLSHDFIVKYYGCLMDSSNYYLVLDHLTGGDLFTLKQQTKLSKISVRQILAEVAVALDVVHRAGLVYRDLKPENVMMNFEGHIRLIDFGTAKELRHGERTYTVCGSPQYLAPEVILAEGHNAAADWWTLGVLLFEMLTG